MKLYEIGMELYKKNENSMELYGNYMKNSIKMI